MILRRGIFINKKEEKGNKTAKSQQLNEKEVNSIMP